MNRPNISLKEIEESFISTKVSEEISDYYTPSEIEERFISEVVEIDRLLNTLDFYG